MRAARSREIAGEAQLRNRARLILGVVGAVLLATFTLPTRGKKSGEAAACPGCRVVGVPAGQQADRVGFGSTGLGGVDVEYLA